MFLPHLDVLCDLLLNRRTATWNLFVLYNNDKAFFILKSKAGLLGRYPLGEPEKKPFDGNLLSIQNEAISLVTMRSKEL